MKPETRLLILVLVLVVAGQGIGYVLTDHRLDQIPAVGLIDVETPYLDVPTTFRRLNQARLRPHAPKRAGLVVVYVGNRYSPLAKDVVYKVSQHREEPSFVLSHRRVLEPGDRLEIRSDEPVDVSVGTLFVEVVDLATGKEGLLDYETLIGETRPDGVDWAFDAVGPDAMNYMLRGTRRFPEDKVELLEAGDYHATLNAGKERVHPLYAAGIVLTVLNYVQATGAEGAERERIVAAVTRFFDEYAIPEADALAEDVLAWRYEFDWPIHFGITLTPPWYSAYANSAMGYAAAIMFRLTGEARFRDVAEGAFNYLLRRIEEGGATYEVDGFLLPAEYVYDTPPMPNVRVFDGELITAVNTYNTAEILGDPVLLQLAATYGAGLAAQLDLHTTDTNYLMNARYPWLIDSETYLRGMRQAAYSLAAINKDRTYVEHARRWQLSSSVWQ